MDKLILEIHFQTVTQIHIGSGDNEGLVDNQLMRRVDGKYIIPGSSLAGVLRARATRLFPRLFMLDQCLAFDSKNKQLCTCAVCSLFGQINPDAKKDSPQTSKIMVDDAQLMLSDKTLLRDGIGIDRETRTVVKAAKFDYETIPPETDVILRIEGNQLTELEEAMLVVLISEIDLGRISIGGKSSRGLGRIRLKDSNQKKEVFAKYLKSLQGDTQELIKLLKEDDWFNIGHEIHNWYEERLIFVINSYQPCSIDQMSIKGFIRFDEGLLIKDNYIGIGTSFDSVPHMLKIRDQLHTYLPGSSLRGVLRSQAERIVRTVVSDQSIIGDSAEQLLSLASDLFGDKEQGSRLKIRDGQEAFEVESQAAMYSQDFLAIDRFTGGGRDGKKFDTVAVYRPRYELEFVLEQPEDWEIGWLLLTIRDLNDGLAMIGSGSAKGFGRAEIEVKNTTVLLPQNSEISGTLEDSGVLKAKQLSLASLLEDEKVDTYIEAFTQKVKQEGASREKGVEKEGAK
ncbi:RAMP superfamily CRISPR-associated protein [Desulfosporosinus sp. BICA1-9]|uniref:RAMP superfamily CRISPR-associated protein n=1 Tax=Desulfosporosinus sp. BICA1-9 TaxID=1531958 RepID=UPI00054B2E1F|nr:RAMP superfamily CRISPR-associated protein [Desulfosporosinus sp. BICA1-9]KJS47031.1 MAG: hypothetical protein VR66_22010 [Peptococcaceae bacterium BRH_c23]KJS87117.1 MAG: hypothetical protein JL57_14865 [Desulfosporosinus sp. BICA1-9]HBW37363.1 hypothetical protein [Desulfosporosinus sp.]